MTRVLVLGGTGFVGRNAVEYFASKPEREVIAVSHTRPKYDLPNVTWKYADLCNKEDVNNLFSEQYDVVIQAAAATSGCKDTLLDPALHIPTNAVMNSYIMKAVVDAKVKHFIFPSCSVMYHSSELTLKETDLDFNRLLNPAYLGFASTKLYCEKLCEFYAGISDTKFTVMRNSNFFGPYDKFDLQRSHVSGATITKVMTATDTVKVWGTGEEARDILHIDGFCEFVELAIEKQPTKFAIYNVGSGQATKIKDLVQKVISASGKTLTIEHDLSAPTIVTSFALNCTKAREELGWKSEVTLEEGIVSTLNWWRANVG